MVINNTFHNMFQKLVTKNRNCFFYLLIMQLNKQKKTEIVNITAIKKADL